MIVEETRGWRKQWMAALTGLVMGGLSTAAFSEYQENIMDRYDEHDNYPVQVVNGNNFSCIKTIHGWQEAQCWGSNKYGAVGPRPVAAAPYPDAPADVTYIPLGGNIKVLSAENDHVCAIITDVGASATKLKCWGSNSNDQLGNFSPVTDEFSPSISRTPVVAMLNVSMPLTNVNMVATGGFHTCVAAGLNNLVMCFGANNVGQLGRGNQGSNQMYAFPVFTEDGSLLSEVKELVAGDYHTCALRNDGKVLCWGLNASGQLGTWNYATQTTATVVANTEDGSMHAVTHIAAGSAHSCASVDEDERVYCWGSNSKHQLGNPQIGVNAIFVIPTKVRINRWNGGGYFRTPDALIAGGDSTCLATRYIPARFSGDDVYLNSQLVCWGDNRHAQLGVDPMQWPYFAPRNPMLGIYAIWSAASHINIAMGKNHMCINGPLSLECRGSNDRNQLGKANLPLPYSMDFVVPTTLK